MSELENPEMQHFMFECNHVGGYSERGVPLTQKVSVQFSSKEGLVVSDVIAQFEIFLKACGYGLDGKYLNLVPNDE